MFLWLIHKNYDYQDFRHIDGVRRKWVVFLKQQQQQQKNNLKLKGGQT